MKISSLGFPRIGRQRELKFALERYWRAEISLFELKQVASELKKTHWQWQADAGVELVPVGDFAYYDQVLTLSATLNVIPNRHRATQADGSQAPIDIDTLLLGPVTYLYLSKSLTEFNKLSLLPQLLTVYQQILQRFADQGVSWVQLDEPVLAADLTEEWQQAIRHSYQFLAQQKPVSLKILLASYYGSIGHHQALVSALPVDGLHLDLVTAPQQVEAFIKALGSQQVLSVGVINGRNVWAADVDVIADQLAELATTLGDRLWIAPSCSLLHCPVDVDVETQLISPLQGQLAFAKQKLFELSDIQQLINDQDSQSSHVCYSLLRVILNVIALLLGVLLLSNRS